MEQKALIVMNPFSGTRRANPLLADIILIANQQGYECITYMTLGQGSGRQIVRENADKVNLVIGIGGDGTFNEVISGIMDAGISVPIGYIPAGSTNDFANSLNLSKNIKEAAKNIFSARGHALDIGKFNQRYFSYVASCGAFTKASYSAPQNVKNSIGHLAYILEGIKDLSTIRPVHLKLETAEQTIEGDYIFTAVSNTTSIGGILTLDKEQVSMSDGKFEIMLIKSPADVVELGKIIISLQTQKYDESVITFFNTDKAKIYAGKDTPWSLDGEMAEGSECVEVKNLQHAITLWA